MRHFVIVDCGHPLAQKATVRPKDILDLPFVSREEGSGTREFIHEYLARNGAQYQDLNISMEVGSPEAITGAVESGFGISVVSQAILVKELKLTSLIERPLDPPLERPFSIVYQRQRFRLRAMNGFMDFAHQHCEKRLSQAQG